jgi:hypothetical protein
MTAYLSKSDFKIARTCAAKCQCAIAEKGRTREVIHPLHTNCRWQYNFPYQAQ